LQTKDGFLFFLFFDRLNNSAKRVTLAQLTVPFGTVRRSAGLRPGVVWDWNIEHRIENVRMKTSMFGVRC
jgi:hypothetical protein